MVETRWPFTHSRRLRIASPFWMGLLSSIVIFSPHCGHLKPGSLICLVDKEDD